MEITLGIYVKSMKHSITIRRYQQVLVRIKMIVATFFETISNLNVHVNGINRRNDDGINESTFILTPLP